jgi:assimilatory nitrate reductase catalytic subunit
MTRTGKSPRLMAQFGEPHVEINPRDAATCGVNAADLVTISTEHGSVVVRALVTERQPQGTLFLPMHWTEQLASSPRTGALVGAALDPVSGQPELKHVPAKIARYAAVWYGYAVSAHRPRMPSADYWAIARARHGWRMELAGTRQPQDWHSAIRTLAGLDNEQPADVLAYADAASGQHRWAMFAGAKLSSAIFIGPAPVPVSRDHLASLLGETFETQPQRHGVLAGRSSIGQFDPGPCVCACMSVGRNEILAAIGPNCQATVEGIGRATGAGTGCGSCRAEIAAMVAASAPVSA